MKKINTALFCLFVLLFCSCDVLNKAPLDEIADDSFWSDETLVKYYVNDLYSEISVDGLQLQENRSDNSVSAQRDKYRLSLDRLNGKIERYEQGLMLAEKRLSQGQHP